MADNAVPIWHLAKGDQKLGVFTSQQLAEMGQQGRLSSDMKVWKSGMPDWQPASKVRGLRVTPVPEEPPPLVADLPSTVFSPEATPSPTVVMGHVTIEKTSKRLKAQILIGLGFLVSGLILLALAFLIYGTIPTYEEWKQAHSHLPNGQQPWPWEWNDQYRTRFVVVGFLVFFGVIFTFSGAISFIYHVILRWWEHG